MLTKKLTRIEKQRGISLLIALIVLVPMTLAAIALTRSVDTAGVISGNLAFKQSASHSADAGIETAVAWLEANNSGGVLYNSNFPQGYAAFRQDPAAGQTWDQFWTTVLMPAGQYVSIGADAAGNQVSYAIHRLCRATGDPRSPGVECSQPPPSTACSGNSMGSGGPLPQNCGQIYYRITARVDGPRNTVSYVQVIVAM